MTKNNNKGFTLIEMVVAMGIVVMIIGFSIASMSALGQAKIKKASSQIISQFELARNYAKTHGGDAMIEIQKVKKGIKIIRESNSVIDDTILIEDPSLEVFYKETGDDTEYHLGVAGLDAPDVGNATLKMAFSQTDGAIIGPNFLDSITISNGSKASKMLIKQSTGMIYYEYEVADKNAAEDFNNKKSESDIKKVPVPCFKNSDNQNTTQEISIKKSSQGNTVQPTIVFDSKHVKIDGIYRAKEVGRYVITFSLKDPYFTCWEGDLSNTPKELVWNIVE